MVAAGERALTLVAVFGGYGTFGAHVSRGLAAAGLRLRVIGRSADRARAFATALPGEHEAMAADVTSSPSCRAAIQGCAVAVSCAGPFGAQGEALLAACVEVGVHYADIAEDRAHAARVRAWGPRFDAIQRTAAYGCSSLPGLSEALAVRARTARPGGPREARVVLFIGNDNAKGPAAVAALAGELGRTIATPQGPRPALANPETVSLPRFGRRRVVTFESADYDLLPGRLGVEAVRVQVGFELGGFTAALPLFSRLAAAGLPAAALVRALARAGGWLRFGSSGGAVFVELAWPDGHRASAALVADRDGQRMAALPCVAVTSALALGTPVPSGARTAVETIGADTLLAHAAAEGFRLETTG